LQASHRRRQARTTVGEGPGTEAVRGPGPDRLRDVPDEFGVDPVGLRLHENDLHAIHPLWDRAAPVGARDP